MVSLPLFADRADAGRLLGDELERRRVFGCAVAVGLARGGVVVAAQAARVLGADLEVVVARKIGHPFQPEYALGAVAGDCVYVRGRDGLTAGELDAAVARTRREASSLERCLRGAGPVLDLEHRTALLLDDGLATGATMIAAARWARSCGAAEVVAAVPVAARESLGRVRRETDDVVCLYELDEFSSVGVWYRDFSQVDDEEVIRLLAAARGGRLVSAAR